MRLYIKMKKQDTKARLDNLLARLMLINRSKKKNKKHKTKSRNTKQSSPRFSSICTLTNSLIRKAINDSKKKKEKKASKSSEVDIIDIEEDRELIVNGGYGTVSSIYASAPIIKYVNYDKLFSHIGSFKANYNQQQALMEFGITPKGDDATREMVSTEVIDKAAKHFKYFVRGEILGDVGYVPPTGSSVNSKDWEKYRIMSQMSIYQPLLKLKNFSA